MKRKLVNVLLILAMATVLFGMACEPPPPPPPPPPPQDWGCSPGFWKNHTEPMYWGPVSTGALYNDYFAVPAISGWTLLAALKHGGGGDYQAARMNVAGMLNTASGTWCPGD